jgi:endonuclease/exonuclease/phosphatase family metal-dependent hydrolase
MPASEGRAVPLRVATFNIHQGVGGDGRRDPARVSAVIRGLAAGVVALQEVDSAPLGPGSFQMDYLAGTTGYTAVPGTTIHGGGCDFGNVLLSAYPVTAVRHIDLSVRDREPRGAIDAELRVAGRPLRVLATHLGLRARERARQTEWLLAALGVGDGPPAVLLGDINEWWPWSRSLRRLRRRLGGAPAPPAYPAGWPILALDRIWAASGASLADVRAVRTPQARAASDHLPVVGRVWLPAGGAGPVEAG